MKFDVETSAAFLAALRAAATKGTAAKIAGISRMTAWRWEQRGRADIEDGIDSEFARFAHGIDEAEASVVARAENAFAKAAASGLDWRASRDYVKARNPQEWEREITDLEREELWAELVAGLSRVAPPTFVDDFHRYLSLAYSPSEELPATVDVEEAELGPNQIARQVEEERERRNNRG